jgi:dipeptidyl aminopeptidase/acylaminoacyl peptidase
MRVINPKSMRTTKKYTIGQRLFPYFLSLSGLLFLIPPCSVFGQGRQTKQLTSADYHLWSHLTAENISDRGKWVSYSLSYESGNDTLFVKNNKEHNTYPFAGGHTGTFNAEKWFACLDKKDRLTLLNLENGKKECIVGVTSYTFTADGRFLIIFARDSDNKKQLRIKSLETKEQLKIENATLYSYNSDAAAIAYATESTETNTFGLVFLGDKPTNSIITKDDAHRFSKIVWQDKGQSVAFLQQPVQSERDANGKACIGYYSLADQKSYTFNPDKIEGFPKDQQIMSESFSNLLISKDGKRIFFDLMKNPQNNTVTDTLQVQIWNTEDKQLYPAKKEIDGWNTVAKVAVWWPESNQFSQLTNNEFPHMILTGDQKQLLTYNPLGHEPQSSLQYAPWDIYIHALENGQKKLLLQNQTADGDGMFVSPSGKYITYFRDGNWWVYDMAKELHINLTKKLSTNFYNKDYDRPTEGPVYGNPGWTVNDSTLFLYDQYDIWELTPDGSSAIRLTSGRENQIQFRIVRESEENKNQINFNGFTNGLFQLTEGLLLEAKGQNGTGYYLWQKSHELTPLVFKNKQVSQLKRAAKNASYMYVEEAYDSPPCLRIQYEEKGKPKEVFQSNPQQKKYAWGKVERISYTNSKGKTLAGLLYYPAGYQSDKKYPMIVYVYEKLSGEFYNYINPSEYNDEGFVVTNYTTQGYFVLLPDIVYEIGNPGSSATDCVVAATNAAINWASIDRKSLGLIGHSFGGYETDFIITQTNIFATAVAGSALTDYTSAYFTVDWDVAQPNFYQFETWQLRMGKPFFGDEIAYMKNSPLFQAPKVETPLLSWTGEKDYRVFYHQSIAFYMALRRLEKKHIMLIYPGQRHVIHDRKYQKDLSRRIEQWFGFYLKKEKQPQWFNVDVLR